MSEMAEPAAAAAIEPAPAPAPTVELGSAVTHIVARLSEAGAMVGAGLYTLGVLRISGELRELHLSTPTVLSTFSHHDVLMKGVGVLVSHLASAIVLGILLTLFASPLSLAALNRRLVHASRLPLSVTAAVTAGTVFLVLTARYWEGLVYVLIALGSLGRQRTLRRPVSRGMLLGLMAIGVMFIGLFGSYFHAPPLMTMTADRDGRPDTGLLVGVGPGQSWFVAVQEQNHFNLEQFGGADEKVTNMRIHPADDKAYRTVFFEIWDTATGTRHSVHQPLDPNCQHCH